MSKENIKNIKSRYILDSRGNPTIEVDVILENGIIGRAAVPSGASTGAYEAIELRDGDSAFLGKGVNKAIANVQKIIKPLLYNNNVVDIMAIDNKMIAEDGTNNKSNLGANAILAVSLAALKAGAQLHKLTNYEYINMHYPSKKSLPMPMMNILNGGSHADNTVDIQEFMIYPVGFSTFKRALQAGTEIFHNLKAILKNKNYSIGIGDEGGFAPSLGSNEEAIELILEAINKSGYTAGTEIYLALDVAASEFYDRKSQTYSLQSDKKKLNTSEMILYYKELCNAYPIISIEDPLYEDDWIGWNKLNAEIGDRVQIVGDDLTVTNIKRLKRAILEKSINAILIKLNQIGSFTETMSTILLAQKEQLGTIISHRSGETEDTLIADLAVACNAGQIKTGSLCRTERTAKYNELIRIEEKLGTNNIYANKNYIKCTKKLKKN